VAFEGGVEPPHSRALEQVKLFYSRFAITGGRCSVSAVDEIGGDGAPPSIEFPATALLKPLQRDYVACHARTARSWSATARRHFRRPRRVSAESAAKRLCRYV